MLTLADGVELYICTVPIDMRRSIDGLCMAVVELLEEAPQSAKVFIFCNKYRDKVKLLHWDKNGFVLLYKRLEKGRFKIPLHEPTRSLSIKQHELSWLLAGFDFMHMRQHPEFLFENYF